jgi:hypothetical protein
MTANELRIGNLVRCILPFYNGEIVAITYSDLSDIVKDTERGRKHNFEPVMLTPEILEATSPNLQEYGYSFRWVRDRLDIMLGSSYINTISYLHQYQNFCFALIDEELTINISVNENP